MWKKTNYPAQMEMLKEAGLNPALLYGMSGGGGTTTGSQSGGSAASAKAPEQIDVSGMLSLSKLRAETKLLESQAKKAEAEATKTSGVDTEKGFAEINKIKQETTHEEVKTKLTQIEYNLKSIEELYKADEITTKIRANLAEAKKLETEGKLLKDQYSDLVKITAEEAIGVGLKNILTKAQTGLTEEQTQATITGIQQKWADQQIKMRELGIKDKERQIKEFEANLKGEFPNVWNVAGELLQMLIDEGLSMSETFKSKENRDRKEYPRKVEYK